MVDVRARRLWAIGFVVACGDSRNAPPPTNDAVGGLAVTVIAPNGGESSVAAEPLEIRWSGPDVDSVVEIAQIDASGTAVPIQTGLAAVAGGGSLTWAPTGVAGPASFRIRVTATAGTERGVDESDGTFTVSPPATGISLARDIQPIFNASCLASTCHDLQSQTASLVLTAGRAYASLVNVSSIHAACASYQRVAPGQPASSFLVFKVVGSGTCFAGVRMPKDGAALSNASIQLVRDWIAQGAKNN